MFKGDGVKGLGYLSVRAFRDRVRVFEGRDFEGLGCSSVRVRLFKS